MLLLKHWCDYDYLINDIIDVIVVVIFNIIILSVIIILNRRDIYLEGGKINVAEDFKIILWEARVSSIRANHKINHHINHNLNHNLNHTVNHYINHNINHT